MDGAGVGTAERRIIEVQIGSDEESNGATHKLPESSAAHRQPTIDLAKVPPTHSLGRCVSARAAHRTGIRDPTDILDPDFQANHD